MLSSKSGIAFVEVVPELRHAIPEFQFENVNLDDPITYEVLHDLIRFTFEIDPDLNSGLVQRIFDFWERLCASPDREVQMLTRDIAWTVAEQADLQRFKTFLGRRFRKYVRDSPAGSALLK
jgi:hypothetical protein